MHVNMNEDYEVRYWTEKFGVTKDQLGSEKLLGWPKAKKLWAIGLWKKLLTHVGGRARIARWMAPA